MRLIFWVAIYLMTLGAISVRAKYNDGLEIKLNGWLELIGGKK